LRDPRIAVHVERRMMQCRMCSQRLTRPGKLCRECEHELERARQAGVSIGELVPPLATVDTSHMTGTRWVARLRSPGPVVAAAFAIGLVGAVSLHAIESSTAGVSAASVMLDADIRHLKPRAFGPAAPVAAVEAPPVTRDIDAMPLARSPSCGGTVTPQTACADTARDHLQ
jgi:hypothetical protein